MNNIYRVVLFGRRDFDGYEILDTQLFELLKRIINEKSFVEIYVGRNGEFDIYAASVVKRVQRVIGKLNNELICVLPYSVRDIEYYDKYYDSVKICDLKRCHPKCAITKRNRWLVEICDLVVCYIEREVGGAYKAVKYASKLKKKIIDLHCCE